MIKLRDTRLDEIRACLALYTVWGHVFAWNNILYSENSPVNLRVWVVSPMVIFFFLIGVTNSLGRKRPAKEFLKARISRIYRPYLIYAVCAVIVSLMVCAIEGVTYADVTSVFMRSKTNDGSSLNFFSPGSPVYWLIPLDYSYIPIPQSVGVLVNHLWFLPVYIFVIMLFPILRNINEKLKRRKWIPLAVLFLLVLILRAVKVAFWRPENALGSQIGSIAVGLPMNIVCYSFWMYLGFYYPSLRHPTKRTKINALLVSASGFLMLIGLLLLPKICSRLNITLSVFWQEYIYAEFGFIKNELPANLVYMLEYIAVFPILYLMTPYILKFIRFLRRKIRIADGLFKLYESSYLVIFLFSSFSFLFVNWILKGLGVYGHIIKNEFIGMLILTLIMIPLCGKIGKWLSPKVESAKLLGNGRGEK